MNPFAVSSWIDKERSYSCKGICMIMIILHHVDCYMNHSAGFMESWGYIATGVFLFLSGFGLFCSLGSKEHIEKDWLVSKMKMLLLPFVFMFLVYVLLLLILLPGKFISSYKDLPFYFITLTVPYTETWFFKIIIFLYFLTFVVFNFLKNKMYRVILITFVCFCYFIVAHHYLPAYWSTSILNYPLGMIAGLFYKKLPSPKIYYPLIALVVLMFTLRYAVAYPFAISIIATLFVMTIMPCLNINSYVLDFIGHKSLDFYLFQLVVLPFCAIYLHQWIVYSVVVFIITIILTFLFEFIKVKLVECA